MPCGVQISPDGKLLAYLAPSVDKDVLNVWVRSVDVDDARMVTNDQLRGIRCVPQLADMGQMVNWDRTAAVSSAVSFTSMLERPRLHLTCAC